MDDALRVKYEAWVRFCAERLTANLVWVTRHPARRGEIVIDEELLQELSGITVSAVERRLSQLRQNEPGLPRRPPWREEVILRGIPTERFARDMDALGHIGANLVYDCESSTHAVYMCTLTMGYAPNPAGRQRAARSGCTRSYSSSRPFV